MGGIYTLASGFPFSAALGFDPSNTGSQGLLRPDQLRDGNLSSDKRSPNLWFDINAFAPPAGNVTVKDPPTPPSGTAILVSLLLT